MNKYEVYVHLKNWGADCYCVNADDEAEAKMRAVQRVLCETAYTIEEIEVLQVIRIRG